MGPASSERISICVHSSGCQVDNNGPHPFPKQPQFYKFDMQNDKTQQNRPHISNFKFAKSRLPRINTGSQTALL